jgi:hypothetical protein
MPRHSVEGGPDIMGSALLPPWYLLAEHVRQPSFATESDTGQTNVRPDVYDFGLVGGSCVCPRLNGRCVLPVNTGWDWLEFRPASGDLSSAPSSAVLAVAPRNILCPWIP